MRETTFPKYDAKTGGSSVAGKMAVLKRRRGGGSGEGILDYLMNRGTKHQQPTRPEAFDSPYRYANGLFEREEARGEGDPVKCVRLIRVRSYTIALHFHVVENIHVLAAGYASNIMLP